MPVPIETYRNSCGSDSSSMSVIAKSSTKTGTASVKRTSCFLKFASALRGSHSQLIPPLPYARIVHQKHFAEKHSTGTGKPRSENASLQNVDRKSTRLNSSHLCI